MDNYLTLGLQKWDYSGVERSLDEFFKLYDERPIKNNQGGMNTAHLFWLWYVCRSLRPHSVIESGVYKGQGTWFFRKTLPDVNLYCIDPNLDQREYIDERAKYYSHDFSLIDWNRELGKNGRAGTLLFFDDHQNAYERMQQMKWMGFNEAMFEDNYPSSQGDCYSIKKIISGKGFRYNGKVVVPENNSHRRYFEDNIECYTTFPPLVRTEFTRWGDRWDDANYPTSMQLLAKDTVNSHPILLDDAKGYTWICYIKLR